MGIARDKFGTKIITCLSLILVVVGMVGVGLCDPSNQVALLTVSLFLIGLGSGAQLCVQPVAGLFPNHVGIVLSSLSGAFQISGLMFLVLTIGGGDSSSSRNVSFLVFAAGIVVLTIVAAVILPRGNSFLLPETGGAVLVHGGSDGGDDDNERNGSTNGDETMQPIHQIEKDGLRVGDNDDRQDFGESSLSLGVGKELTLLVSESEKQHNRVDEKVDDNSSSDYNHIDNSISISQKSDLEENDEQQTISPTAFQQMKTAEYILLVTWFSICIVPMQYYIGIIGFQLEELGDDSGLYTNIFSYCYAGAAITAPVAGYIADKYGLGVAQGLFTLIVAISFFLLALKDRFGSSNSSSSLNVQIIGLATYGIGRMGIFGMYFTNCGKRFGYKNFGTLAGLGLLITAIVSILQYPLIAWTVNGHSTVVNTVLGIALVLQSPYFLWLHRREKLHKSAVSRSPPKK